MLERATEAERLPLNQLRLTSCASAGGRQNRQPPPSPSSTYQHCSARYQVDRRAAVSTSLACRNQHKVPNPNAIRRTYVNFSASSRYSHSCPAALHRAHRGREASHLILRILQDWQATLRRGPVRLEASLDSLGLVLRRLVGLDCSGLVGLCPSSPDGERGRWR